MFSRPRSLSSVAATNHGAHGRVARGDHRVPGPRVVVPAGVRLDVHVGQLPDLARVVDPPLEPARLLLGADLEPVLDEDDPAVDHRLLDGRHLLQEPVRLLGRAEAHHPLDAGAVVPAAVEDHDLAGRREVADVALDVHLGPLALGRGGQGDDLEHARADALGDPLDRAALAGGVAALEHDAHPRTRRLDPLLHRDELAMELAHLAPRRPCASASPAARPRRASPDRPRRRLPAAAAAVVGGRGCSHLRLVRSPGRLAVLLLAHVDPPGGVLRVLGDRLAGGVGAGAAVSSVRRSRRRASRLKASTASLTDANERVPCDMSRIS